MASSTKPPELILISDDEDEVEGKEVSAASKASSGELKGKRNGREAASEAVNTSSTKRVRRDVLSSKERGTSPRGEAISASVVIDDSGSEEEEDGKSNPPSSQSQRTTRTKEEIVIADEGSHGEKKKEEVQGNSLSRPTIIATSPVKNPIPPPPPQQEDQIVAADEVAGGTSHGISAICVSAASVGSARWGKGRLLTSVEEDFMVIECPPHCIPVELEDLQAYSTEIKAAPSTMYILKFIPAPGSSLYKFVKDVEKSGMPKETNAKPNKGSTQSDNDVEVIEPDEAEVKGDRKGETIVTVTLQNEDGWHRWNSYADCSLALKALMKPSVQKQLISMDSLSSPAKEVEASRGRENGRWPQSNLDAVPPESLRRPILTYPPRSNGRGTMEQNEEEADIDRIILTVGDQLRLLPGEFLNDSIVDFYLRFMHRSLAPLQRDRLHIFSSFFYTRLTDGVGSGHNISKSFYNVEKWTQRVDIFAKDVLLVPINGQLHWSLAVIIRPYAGALAADGEIPHVDVEREEETFSVTSGKGKGEPLRPCILFLDSLQCHEIDVICVILRRYLELEYQSKRGKRMVFTPSSLPVVVPEVPRQQNSCDCGVYLLMYAGILLSSLSQGSMPSLHPRIFSPKDVENLRGDISNVIEAMASADKKEAAVGSYSS